MKVYMYDDGTPYEQVIAESDAEAWVGLQDWIREHPDCEDSFRIAETSLDTMWWMYRAIIENSPSHKALAQAARSAGWPEELLGVTKECLYGNIVDVFRFTAERPSTTARWVDAAVEQFFINQSRANIQFA